MARRRFGRAVRRGPKNNIWTVILMDELTVGTTAIEVNIVQGSDWTGSVGGFQRATVMRVRGWLSVSADPTLTVATSYFMMIYVTDEDTAVQDPSALQTYADEDILWTGGFALAAGNAGAVEQRKAVYDTVIDIKSMRKLSIGQELRLSMISGDSGAAISVAGLLRGLVRKGGN